ncbi:MAG TPA: hypothetical protein DDW65_08285 [Firmicutes bacterium]|jgi:PAS domain S-box-containing protein|nr:hypothetical protein [Bacillota bacterium]
MLDGMTEQIVRIMYENLPVEIMVIDAEDEIISWNKHDTRLFKRPMTAMGIDFRTYHPADSFAKAEQVIFEMKQGRRDKASFWFDLKIDTNSTERKVLVEFYALRDYNGKYLGCMQCTQDIEDIRHVQGEQRLSEDPRYESLRSVG